MYWSGDFSRLGYISSRSLRVNERQDLALENKRPGTGMHLSHEPQLCRPIWTAVFLLAAPPKRVSRALNKSITYDSQIDI